MELFASQLRSFNDEFMHELYIHWHVVLVCSLFSSAYRRRLLRGH